MSYNSYIVVINATRPIWTQSDYRFAAHRTPRPLVRRCIIYQHTLRENERSRPPAVSSISRAASRYSELTQFKRRDLYTYIRFFVYIQNDSQKHVTNTMD